MHDSNAIFHLSPRGRPILYSVLAQFLYRLALFPRGSPLLKRNAVLFLYLTYHLPSVCRFAVSDCPVGHWLEVMSEVDAKVEIGHCFCVMLVVHTTPVMVVIVSGTVLVNDTSTVFSVRPFDVQSKSGRVRGV